MSQFCPGLSQPGTIIFALFTLLTESKKHKGPGLVRSLLGSFFFLIEPSSHSHREHEQSLKGTDYSRLLHLCLFRLAREVMKCPLKIFSSG